MTARNALAAVLSGGIVFACIGGATGALIANVAPEYYRTVFRYRDLASFNPLQVGIGLGVTQGIWAGVAISFAVLA